MKEDCFRMSLEHCAKFIFLSPINADQTFFFPKPFLHNAADSIHIPLNDAFMYSPINK